MRELLSSCSIRKLIYKAGVHLNKILQTYYQSALNLKLPVIYVNEISSLNISFGKDNYFLLQGITHLNNASSIYLANNKQSTKSLLEHSGISVPKGVTITEKKLNATPLAILVKNLRFPVVIKPTLHNCHDMNVLCNIKTYDELSRHLEKALPTISSILVEEYHAGLKAYRVLLLKNRIIAIVERVTQTVEEQVAFVEININKKNARYLRQAARVTGLELVALDIVCEHINHPFSTTKCFILGASFPPDITLYETPAMDKGIKISKKILLQLILRHPFAYLYHRLKRIWLSNLGDTNG